ncbi:MBL fold metallo-hydrolase [Carboxylicivirga caseinilyticus]|uniref:MBL fold metallo-hydrolase n=1 Tax=Carboxylicivirga caseinilyticus TaxID=3417572 RepID=UPI003D33D6AD|nr:MBL fold metallo-hydrolase [Marinilabiliaceae bacterium A049]
MRKLLPLLIAILMYSSAIKAQKQVFANDELTITQLEDKMWVIETVDNTTMYIIEGDEKAMLIDTGTDCHNLQEVVKKITDKPLYVVITHIHVDHAGNIFDFEDIYFHQADEVLIDRLREPYKGRIHYVKDGDVFDLGNKEIEVKHMPGHTPGSIVLLDYQTGNCYSGDAFGSGQVWCQLWPFSSMHTYEKSCRTMHKLMNNGITKVYCGHYPHIKRAFDKSYIEDMSQLAAMIRKGTQPEPKPHPFIIPVIGAAKPMMSTYKTATIVYDPEHVKKGLKGEVSPGN